MIAKLLTASLIPVIILNVFGHVTGVIWLFILGEWRIVLLGWLISIAFTFVYSVIMIIQVPLAALLSFLQERRKNVALITVVGWTFPP